MSKIDLRDNIETHCDNCSHNGTSACNGCFFASVDMGTPLLGGLETYGRAFKYLKIKFVKGFKRDRPFGNYLNIPVLAK